MGGQDCNAGQRVVVSFRPMGHRVVVSGFRPMGHRFFDGEISTARGNPPPAGKSNSPEMITATVDAKVDIPSGVAQVCPAQVGPAQIGLPQIGPTQIGLPQVCPAQVGPAQVSPS